SELTTMASRRYQKILFVRFATYFMMLTGLAVVFFEFGPLAWAEYSYRKDQLFGVNYSLGSQVVTSSSTSNNNASSPINPASGSAGVPVDSSMSFGDLPDTNEHIIKPVSTKYGIVIEKINANAKVVPDVNPAD